MLHTLEGIFRMNFFNLLNEMIELQRQHGGAQIDATAGTWNGLKAALAALRRKNPTLYAVKLCAERLAPEEQFRAPTGGMVVVRLRLLARDANESASGAQAARLRTQGIQVDGQTRASTSVEVDMDARLARERAAFELWASRNPEWTFEEAAAAGHADEAKAELTFREIERRSAEKERRQDPSRSGGRRAADSSSRIEELLGWRKEGGEE